MQSDRSTACTNCQALQLICAPGSKGPTPCLACERTGSRAILWASPTSDVSVFLICCIKLHKIPCSQATRAAEAVGSDGGEQACQYSPRRWRSAELDSREKTRPHRAGFIDVEDLGAAAVVRVVLSSRSPCVFRSLRPSRRQLTGHDIQFTFKHRERRTSRTAEVTIRSHCSNHLVDTLQQVFCSSSTTSALRSKHDVLPSAGTSASWAALLRST